jgi:hypothetical protein
MYLQLLSAIRLTVPALHSHRFKDPHHTGRSAKMPEGRCNCGSIKISIPEIPKESAICYWYATAMSGYLQGLADRAVGIAAVQAPHQDQLCTSTTEIRSR